MTVKVMTVFDSSKFKNEAMVNSEIITLNH